jgi:hypothetical protein
MLVYRKRDDERVATAALRACRHMRQVVAEGGASTRVLFRDGTIVKKMF